MIHRTDPLATKPLRLEVVNPIRNDAMATEPIEPQPPITITLSEADWDKFVELLENPPPPTEALKALFTKDGPKGDNKPFTLAE